MYYQRKVKEEKSKSQCKNRKDNCNNAISLLVIITRI